MTGADGGPCASPTAALADAPAPRRPGRRRLALALKLAVPLAALGLWFGFDGIDRLARQSIFILAMLDVDAIRGFVAAFGIWAPLVSLGLMVFQAVLAPLPAVVLTFANAALFGWAWGAALSWTGALLGAALCFGLARAYGRGLVDRMVPAAALDRFDGLGRKHGAKAVLVARLLPFVSFDAVSSAAGLTGLGFGRFLVATGVGQLPATVVYSIAGDFVGVDTRLLIGAIVVTGLGSAAFAFVRRTRSTPGRTP